MSTQGLDYVTSAAGAGMIKFERDGEETHEYLRTGNPAVLKLDVNEFITSYTMDLGPYSGNGDITAESNGVYKSVDRDDASAVDVRVLGRPYVYKGQKRPGTNTVSDVADARNKARTWSYNFNNMPTSSSSQRATKARKLPNTNSTFTQGKPNNKSYWNTKAQNRRSST